MGYDLALIYKPSVAGYHSPHLTVTPPLSPNPNITLSKLPSKSNGFFNAPCATFPLNFPKIGFKFCIVLLTNKQKQWKHGRRIDKIANTLISEYQYMHINCISHTWLMFKKFRTRQFCTHSMCCIVYKLRYRVITSLAQDVHKRWCPHGTSMTRASRSSARALHYLPHDFSYVVASRIFHSCIFHPCDVWPPAFSVPHFAVRQVFDILSVGLHHSLSRLIFILNSCIRDPASTSIIRSDSRLVIEARLMFGAGLLFEDLKYRTSNKPLLQDDCHHCPVSESLWQYTLRVPTTHIVTRFYPVLSASLNMNTCSNI